MYPYNILIDWKSLYFIIYSLFFTLGRRRQCSLSLLFMKGQIDPSKSSRQDILFQQYLIFLRVLLIAKKTIIRNIAFTTRAPCVWWLVIVHFNFKKYENSFWLVFQRPFDLKSEQLRLQPWKKHVLSSFRVINLQR